MSGINTEKLAAVLNDKGYGVNIYLTAAICELVDAAEDELLGAFGSRSNLQHRLAMLKDELAELEEVASA